MRTIALTIFVVLSMLRSASAAELTIPAVAGGGFALGAARGVGELLFPGNPSSAGLQLESFSLFVTDPGDFSGLVFTTAVSRVTQGFETPDLPSFNSPIQTLVAGSTPTTHEIVTTIPGGFLFAPDQSYFLYITVLGTIGGSQPWLIETTLTNLYAGGRGGRVDWLTLGQEILEMPNDRDIALHATFSDPTSVPEPTSAVLLGIGAISLFIKHRSNRRTR
jgi:hypothetical protein